jgi:translation initiation factor 1
MEICPVCGLPKELCVCEKIEEAERKIEVSIKQAKFKKLVTVVKGIGEKEIEKVAKELKKRLACGGTIKNGEIILQGDHKSKIKAILLSLGYNEKEISID